MQRLFLRSPFSASISEFLIEVINSILMYSEFFSPK